MSVKTKPKTVRITLDLPLELHTKIKTLASQNGETLRQLFIDLAKTKTSDQNTTAKNSPKTTKKIRKIPKPIPLGVDSVDIQKIIDESLWPKF